MQPPQYGFGRLPNPPRLPPPPAASSSRPFLMLLLVFACIGAGALFAWGRWEHGQRTRLAQVNRQVQDAYVFVLAKKSDVVSFLTDPRTRLFRLAGKGPASGLKAVVAWQEETRSGLLVADRMWLPPDGSHYVLWRTTEDQTFRQMIDLRPQSGLTIREFTDRGPATNTAGFVISIEHATVPRPGQIVYEVR